jgi:hypothetical protein
MSKSSLFLFLSVLLVSACSSQTPAPLIATPTQIVIAVNQTESAPVPEPIPSREGTEDECDNPFYPVGDEATWTYSSSMGGSAVHVMSADDFGKFTTTITSGDSTFTIDGQCTPEGIVIMDVPGATTTYSGQEGNSTVATVTNSGVSLPKDVNQGAQWSQIINVTTEAGTSVIDTNYTAVGFENITVPAGDFYALKVEQSGYVTVFGQKVEMHGFNWYAEGVGVVKSAMDGAPIVELVSYDIPD